MISRSVSGLLLSLLFFLAPIGQAQEVKKAESTETFGVYIASLYNLDFSQKSFNVDFWAWWMCEGSDDNMCFTKGGSKDSKYSVKNQSTEAYLPFNRVEIINAREFKVVESYSRPIYNNQYYAIAKFSAVINQNWDMRSFPFDKQQLAIIIESVDFNASQITYQVDTKNSIIGDDFKLDEWEIKDLGLSPVIHQYNSTFGEVEADKGVFSRVQVTLPIERKGDRLFIDLFIGFFVASLISFLIYLLDPSSLAPRLSLSMSGIFASIGNKYVIDNKVILSTSFSLYDTLQLATFASISLVLIITITCDRLVSNGKQELAKKINKSVGISSFILYILFVSRALLKAV